MTTTTIPIPVSPAIDLRTGYPTREWYRYWLQPSLKASSISNGQLGVANGGTGMASGVPGGVLAFNSSNTMISSDTLANYRIVLGGGEGQAPSTPVDLGSATEFLQGNAEGAPSWSKFVAGQGMAIDFLENEVRFSSQIANVVIDGEDSVTVTGSVATGNVRIALLNDVASPPALSLYGSLTGVPGWQLLSTNFANASGQLDLSKPGNSGAGTLQAVTVDVYGRITGTRAATITGTAGRVTVANGDASAGLPTVDLATVADAGGGALLRFVRDAWGRISGTSAATTTDLTEGSNLYFTAARVLASVLTGLSTATNAVITATDTVLSALGKLQAQINANKATSDAIQASFLTTIAGTPIVTQAGDFITVTN